MLKLNIPRNKYNEIQYYMDKFPDNEWSGPAWFKYTKNKNGFPSSWTLVHFKPIHLGNNSETEYSGSELNKILLSMRNSRPDLKDYNVGLIHSHHSMKAFFSGTDQTQLIENASNSGYPSLVLSSVSKYAFAISYFDQFGIPHIVEAEKVNTTIPTSKEWEVNVKLLKANRKKAMKVILKRKSWNSNKWKSNKQPSLLDNDYDDRYSNYYNDNNIITNTELGY